MFITSFSHEHCPLTDVNDEALRRWGIGYPQQSHGSEGSVMSKLICSFSSKDAAREEAQTSPAQWLFGRFVAKPVFTPRLKNQIILLRRSYFDTPRLAGNLFSNLERLEISHMSALSLYLTLSLSLAFSLFLSTLSIYLSIYVSIYLSIYLSIHSHRSIFSLALAPSGCALHPRSVLRNSTLEFLNAFH